MVQRVEEKRRWATGASEHHRARALYDFTARTPSELSFRRNEALRVAPRDEQPRIQVCAIKKRAKKRLLA